MAAADLHDLTLADLARLPRWVCWATEQRAGRATKVPRNPRAPGANASSTSPDTWAPREIAERAWNGLRHRTSGPGGVGVVLGDFGSGFTLAGIDLDACRDPATGELAPWAAEVLDRIEAYAEVSPSGRGVKLFLTLATGDAQTLRADMGSDGRKWAEPGGGEHGPAIEIYSGGRFFAFTGERLPDAPAELCRVPLDALRWLAREAGPRLAGASRGEERQARGNGHDGADRDDLLARLHKAMGRDPHLARRWGGDTSGLSDSSRSGLAFALCGALKRAGFGFEDACALLRINPHVRD